MRTLIGRSIAIGTTAFLVACGPAAAPDSSGGSPDLPRTADGTPDLNGIWQAIGTAHWDLEDHSARAGAMVPLGAVGAVPAGKGVVVGGEIPYQDWAAEQRQEHVENWLTMDPEIKCYLPM